MTALAGTVTPFVGAVAVAAAVTTAIVGFVSMALVLVSLVANVQYVRGERVRAALLARGQLAPPVTILVPAWNEAGGIVASVRSLLQQTYPIFEVVVVDDGSTDGTFDVLAESFHLRRVPYQAPSHPVPCEAILGVWVAPRHPLRVVRKANGGKADAHNAGLNVTRTPYVCVIDADSVVRRDALDRCVAAFSNDPGIVGVGAGIGILNGCRVVRGNLDRVGLPRNPLALFQVLEYLRAFLYGRIGWSALGATFIVSGAFGVFRRDALEAIGGYRRGALGEDLDLVLRLHLHRAEHRLPWQIAFLPETLCFTEAPTDRRSLATQRIRWERGLLESLVVNRGVLFGRRTGAAGWLAAPYHLLVELLAPVVEVVGLLALGVALAVDAVDVELALLLALLVFLTSLVLSAAALVLDQLTFGLYRRPGQLAALLAVAVAEQFGYRQLTAWWRVRGLVRHLRRRDMTWGTIARSNEWQVDLRAADAVAPRH